MRIIYQTNSKLELQSRLGELETEAAKWKENAASYQKQVSESEVQLRRYMEELKVCREEKLDAEERFKRELETKDKLVHLYEVLSCSLGALCS